MSEHLDPLGGHSREQLRDLLTEAHVELLMLRRDVKGFRAALKEALDEWDARERDVWESTGGDAYGPFSVDPRSAELRKLLG
jgi:hypothetical protein